MKIKNNNYYIAFKSKPLIQVLKDQNISGKHFEIDDIFLKEVSKNKKLASTPIENFIGKGSIAIAIETSDGKVLKLTEGNHYPFARPHEDFDVPVFEQGKIGKIHYYFEEKLIQHGMNDGFILIMRDMIKSKGYKAYDLGRNDLHQIGLSSKGTLHLIDPECAKFKTIFHALWKKTKDLFANKLSSFHFSKALHK